MVSPSFSEFQARTQIVREEMLGLFVLYVVATLLVSRFFKTGKSRRRVYFGALTVFILVVAAYFWLIMQLSGLR